MFGSPAVIHAALTLHYYRWDVIYLKNYSMRIWDFSNSIIWDNQNTSKGKLAGSILYIFYFTGNLLDAQNTLQWLLSQADSASIEEVTGTMMDKLIKETKHLVVLFCKYIGYAIIALTHTCYLLKHYTSTPSQHSTNPPVANGLVQNGRPISPRPGSRNANLHPNAMQNIPGRPISPLSPPTYLPAEKVKGLAMEIWMLCYIECVYSKYLLKKLSKS